MHKSNHASVCFVTQLMCFFIFIDIVIGAPYEDDLKGSVYIYNGFGGGLWPKYSQRINAASLRNGLLGFGASFSNSMDMNNDNINGTVEYLALHNWTLT